MNPNDLQAVLQEAVNLLNNNKETMTPDLLAELTKLQQQAGAYDKTLAIGLGVPVEQVDGWIDSTGKLIALEQQLTAPGTTERFVGILTAVLNRPILLRMLAKVL